MSGHSKWSTIKHKKAANDSVKASVFTKLAKGITVAVKKGGRIADPDNNFALRLAIEKAQAVNMPKANIDRAIAKAMGGSEGEVEELIIEGFGPGGVVVIIEVMTDNRNRSVAEIRSLMEKYGGVMGARGSVVHLFAQDDQGYRALYPIPITAGLGEVFLTQLREHEDIVEVYDNTV